MSKKTWLITGVSSGFGYEITKQLLETGDVVVGTVRNKDKVQSLIEQYPTQFGCQILDGIGPRSIPWTQKVELFYAARIVYLLRRFKSKSTMNPFSVIPGFYIFKDCFISLIEIFIGV